MTNVIWSDKISDRRGPAYDLLKAALAEMKTAVVAFSGGVDSSLVAAAAHDALGERALAVTACSPTYPPAEKQRAIELARLIGIRHELVDSNEGDIAEYRNNPPDRCYFCKSVLYDELQAIGVREGTTVIVDGNNLDDEGDYRPGRRAAREHGVRSPLAELGFGKAAVRAMARERGLPNWNDPACACLASRIPYGQEITPERLTRIDAAELAIRGLGFNVVRVRDHGTLARVELGVEDLDRAFLASTRLQISHACRDAGYKYATLDLDGYRTGSMNAVLELAGRPPK